MVRVLEDSRPGGPRPQSEYIIRERRHSLIKPYAILGRAR